MKERAESLTLSAGPGVPVGRLALPATFHLVLLFYLQGSLTHSLSHVTHGDVMRLIGGG